jgi:outer membrane PBP1 activator LpoA protein
MRFENSVFLVLSLVILVTGCEMVPRTLEPEERAEVERRAVALRSEGKFREAAVEFLRLAKVSDPPVRDQFVLEAAGAYLEEGDLGAAKDLIAEELPAKLTPEIEHRLTLMRAEIALVEQRPFDALSLLPPELRTAQPADIGLRAAELRARALHRSEQYLAAVSERIQLEAALTDPGAVTDNRRRLWGSVSRMFPAELRAAMPSVPDVMSGWLELGVIATELLMQPAALVLEISRWRALYPGHPANPEIVPSLIELARSGAAPPSKVVLLLPLDGPFAAAAAAVRDGFLAAWYDDADNPRRPEVAVQTMRGEDVWLPYQAAVGSGAEFIVGPLERSAVDTIASADALPVPTLALNYATADAQAPREADDAFATVTGGVVTHSAPPPARDRPEMLYQFALSPEDEARMVAKRAWFDGHSKAAVIAPEGDWGNRVADAFVSEWERIGGVVLDVRRFSGDAADISAPISALLKIDASEARRRSLSRIIGEKVEFEARRRQDLDFLFMAAFPVQARQIRPLLKFYHAEAVPVYATSHVYVGMPDVARDTDQDGVMFPDMPWTVAPDDASPIREQVVSAWPNSLPAYLRLFAFGADAYGLVPRLKTLRERRYIEYAGATGALSVDSQNRIERRLLWAKFKSGVPRLLSQPPSQ